MKFCLDQDAANNNSNKKIMTIDQRTLNSKDSPRHQFKEHLLASRQYQSDIRHLLCSPLARWPRIKIGVGFTNRSLSLIVHSCAANSPIFTPNSVATLHFLQKFGRERAVYR